MYQDVPSMYADSARQWPCRQVVRLPHELRSEKQFVLQYAAMVEGVRGKYVRMYHSFSVSGACVELNLHDCDCSSPWKADILHKSVFFN